MALLSSSSRCSLVYRKAIVCVNLRSRQREIMASASRQARMAFVKFDQESAQMSVSFKYDSDLVPERLFTMNRRVDEPIEAALKRLRMNIGLIAVSRLRKKKRAIEKKGMSVAQDNNSGVTQANVQQQDPDEEFQLDISIEDMNGKPLEPQLQNQDAFQTGNVLVIGERRLPIVVNAPTIIRINLPKVMMAGFPVQAYATLENADLSDSVFSWWRNATRGETFVDCAEGDVIKEKSLTWIRIPGETDIIYTPKEKDIGCRLRVCCEPRSGSTAGVPISAYSTAVVAPAPSRCPFEDRHLLTAEVLPDDLLRVVSYNLLADIYAHTNYSKDVLYNYCPNDALDFNYRKHLLVKEILGYNGDILCLQEVDRGMFKYELFPCLSRRGFDGMYGEKDGKTPEGTAMFYRRSKFSLIDSGLDALSKEVQDATCLSDIRDAVNKNPQLLKRMTNRTTVLQRMLLRHNASGRELLVCNTHLYFHPDADHIRLLQAFICMRLAENILENVERETNRKCGLVFCGDFNSTPDFGVYQLFTTGKVSHDSHDWKSNEKEAVCNLTATIGRTLHSAYGRPEYTNYTADFNGCLDYIFHSQELSSESVVPLPPHEVVAHPEFLAIPSPLIPSDHLALVANLRFSENKAG